VPGRSCRDEGRPNIDARTPRGVDEDGELELFVVA